MVYNVRFPCTGNSGRRSIMAEALLNHWGKGRFCAHSSGSTSKGAVHSMALEQPGAAGLSTAGFRSKSRHEFAQADAPVMDFVFTVCGRTASEACPAGPGQPMTAYWGVPDPAAVEGSEAARRQACRDASRVLEARVKPFISLRVAALDRLSLKRRRLDRIGRIEATETAS